MPRCVLCTLPARFRCRHGKAELAFCCGECSSIHCGLNNEQQQLIGAPLDPALKTAVDGVLKQAMEAIATGLKQAKQNYSEEEYDSLQQGVFQYLQEHFPKLRDFLVGAVLKRKDPEPPSAEESSATSTPPLSPPPPLTPTPVVPQKTGKWTERGPRAMAITMPSLLFKNLLEDIAYVIRLATEARKKQFLLTQEEERRVTGIREAKHTTLVDQFVRDMLLYLEPQFSTIRQVDPNFDQYGGWVVQGQADQTPPAAENFLLPLLHGAFDTYRKSLGWAMGKRIDSPEVDQFIQSLWVPKSDAHEAITKALKRFVAVELSELYKHTYELQRAPVESKEWPDISLESVDALRKELRKTFLKEYVVRLLLPDTHDKSSYDRYLQNRGVPAASMGQWTILWNNVKKI
jgi:hypothetical protein